MQRSQLEQAPRELVQTRLEGTGELHVGNVTVGQERVVPGRATNARPDEPLAKSRHARTLAGSGSCVRHVTRSSRASIRRSSAAPGTSDKPFRSK